MKLHSIRFGLALGIIWALCALFLGLMATYVNWGNAMVEVIASLYIGYAPTVAGSFIGLVWAFFDAFIGGFLVAWLYNRLVA